jgi:hypothetical protein
MQQRDSLFRMWNSSGVRDKLPVTQDCVSKSQKGFSRLSELKDLGRTFATSFLIEMNLCSIQQASVMKRDVLYSNILHNDNQHHFGVLLCAQ